MRGYAFFGGSFNPPHIGHLLVALQVAEIFADRLERVYLLPCAHPPHKEEGTLLPFAMRCEMLELALRDAKRVPGGSIPQAPLVVSRLEGERDTPSYTWDTVSSLARRERGRPLFFVLGSDDYEQLHTWHEGLSLPEKTNFVVVPRDGFSPVDFVRETLRMWPHAVCGQEDEWEKTGGSDEPHGASDSLGVACGSDEQRLVARARFASGHEAYFLALPPLAISATDVRKRFLRGGALTFLVPEAVATYLSAHATFVSRVWGDQ